MYDSITARDIPTNVKAVGGYVDGTWKWSAADWARFPYAIHVTFAVSRWTNDGAVGDCETGDMTNSEAVDWVLMRRATGADVAIYTGLGNWPACQAAFQNAGVSPPPWWIAHYDNVIQIPKGAIAKQYCDSSSSGGHYDISIADDFWLEKITGGNVPLTDADATLVANKTLDMPIGRLGVTGTLAGKNTSLRQVVAWFDSAVQSIGGEINTAALTLSNTEATRLTSALAQIVAAVKAQPTGGQVDVTALAASLDTVLPAHILDALKVYWTRP